MSISTANVDQLPMEVLVLIFKFLNLSDIFENCSNTCKIWREIIAQFFLQPYLKILTRLDSDLRDKLHDNGWTEQCFDNDFLYETYEKITSYKAKILVTTGVRFRKAFGNRCVLKTEIVSLNKQDNNNNNDKSQDILNDFTCRGGAVGGLLRGQPIICGGYKHPLVFQDCFFVGQPRKSDHSQTNNMLFKRAAASSIVLSPDTLWIVGGYDPDYDHLNSTEFVRFDEKSIPGPELPFKISGHSMIKYDSNTIFIIGGFQNGIISRQTWIMDTSEGFQFREGPTLNVNRYGHSCGKLISNNGDILIVAAGGRDDSNYLDSVEILDPISNRGWKLGPKLPHNLYGTSMVTSPNGNGVVIIGGYDDILGEDSNLIFEMKGDLTMWRKMKQALHFPRVNHVAIPLYTE